MNGQRNSTRQMNDATSKPLTPTQTEMLKKLEAMKESDIDVSDIAEQLDWKGAERGVFYKPIKQQLTLRIDADVVDWFKQQGEGYQSRINAALREHVGRKVGGDV
jgi:uncharacterized protein (DUF4415 family)